ncbi:reverse transcriptase family protein [Afifella sp. JA880]|uniref:reverse transcriptase family protein n=1 Tax=Afifella sp. JA880 TaxID=2975280 RepID=UPI0021BBA62B|nr:reverse transcriptase family protein [Afifella sp. JA880]MCT8266843.1 reverse transcriptase family protein [Afifella sp. JA880]
MPEKQYPLNQSPFYKLKTRKKLARILHIDVNTLRFLANKSDDLYNEFDIERKTGKMRRIENPQKDLKDIQKYISRKLSCINPPDYLFCPVKGRCYISNAAKHRFNRTIHCLDIRKYFPSTTFERVLWFFRHIMKCSEDVSWHLSRIATFKGYLPTGSPLSPIMSYFAHYDVWEEISAICKKNDYCLTVYIDDVTISGNNISPEVIWSIKRIIHRSGLRYHKEKKYIDRPAEITGAVIKNGKLMLPHRQHYKTHKARSDLFKATNEQDKRKQSDKLTGLKSQFIQIENFCENWLLRN